MPRISIVILTFSSIEFIKSCLDSIFNQDYQDFEIIVVDNGSRDGTSDFIRKEYPWVILIENKQNLGTCRARNQGIKESRGEWILTLDCDIILKEDTGYFDERFFFLVEDVDLAWRAQKKGWKALFYPEAVCYHNGNSSQAHKNIRQYYCFRNRYLMINKNENIFGKIKLIPIFLLYDLPRSLFILFNCRRLNLKEVICPR